VHAVEVGDAVGLGHGQDDFESQAGPREDAAGDNSVGPTGEGGNHDQWQRSRIGGQSRSMIRSSAWSIAVLRADVAVSLWCPVTRDA
jgi:hypothetical protein